MFRMISINVSLLECNRPLIVLQHRLSLRSESPQDLHLVQLGNKPPHIVVQRNLALLNQPHEAGRREELGDGSAVGKSVAIEDGRADVDARSPSRARVDDACRFSFSNTVMIRLKVNKIRNWLLTITVRHYKCSSKQLVLGILPIGNSPLQNGIQLVHCCEYTSPIPRCRPTAC